MNALIPTTGFIREPSSDPAKLGWPPTLPIEIALRTASIKNICLSYGITQEEWEALRQDPRFVKDVQTAHDELKKDGMGFRLKARLQSEELLKTSWKMIHAGDDVVPPSVKADLLKFTVRAAGLDGSQDQKNANSFAPTLQIQINL